MEGYLMKWINILYRWQSRYFILHDGVLIYCQQKEQPIKGQIHLSICSIRLVKSDPLRIVINYGMSEMHLKASSRQELEKWYLSLTASQEKVLSFILNKKSFLILQYQLANQEQLLMKQQQKQQFQCLNGVPILDFDMIHDSLTKIWSCEAQLQEKVSLLKGNLGNQIQAIASDMKNIITTMAQQIDSEYKKLIKISQKLMKKINEINDINPPDNLDDDQQFVENKTIFESFCDEEDYLSFNEEDFNDEQQQQQQIINQNLQEKKKPKRQEFNNKKYLTQVTDESKSIIEILEPLKTLQEIKYKNIISNDSFKDMILGIEDNRKILPCFKDPNEKLRIFSVLKDMMGQDLTKISLPVTFNEPLSILQVCCENLEYYQLLETANREKDQGLRMAYCMAFAVSSCCSTIGRNRKPFNPILGETYQYESPGFKYIAEQVSHHPPISAAYAESESFKFWGNLNVVQKFSGTSIDFTQQGYFHIELNDQQDHISYKKSKSSLRNLMIGKQYMENYGEMNFINRRNGDIGQLNLSERGWNGGNMYALSGWVKDQQGQLKYTITGKWDSQIQAQNNITKQNITLWNSNKLPPQSDQQYHFTQLSIDLNNLNQKIFKIIPPTDSRIRPDQRALENGNIDVAIIEKARLEQKQRDRRKQLSHQNQQHNPKWFKTEFDPITKENAYKYIGNYWDLCSDGQIQNISYDLF